MRLPISAVIPVKNEETEIKDLVKNLEFANEIIFVDNGSGDKTKEYIKKTRAKVYYCGESSFAKLRQFGDDKSTQPWVLSMDADMRVTPMLKAELEKIVFESQLIGYKIGRRNIIFGKEMFYTDWSPRDDYHTRLYKKAYGKWRGDVHETWTGDKNEVGMMESSFLHYNYKDVEEYLEKINKYSEIGVKTINLVTRRWLVPKMLWWGLKDFVKRYFYKLGFLDGYHGLMLSYLQVVYYLTLGVKAYEKTRN